MAIGWVRYPTTFPSFDPTPPPVVGNIAPGFDDIPGSTRSPEQRRRLLNRTERVEVGKAFLDRIGGIKPAEPEPSTPSGRITDNTITRGIENLEAKTGLNKAQMIFIVVAGVLLLIGIFKGGKVEG